MSMYLTEFEKDAVRTAKNIAYIEGYEPLMAYRKKVLMKELETNSYVIGEYDYDTRDLRLTGRKRKKKEEAVVAYIAYCLPEQDIKGIVSYVEDTVTQHGSSETAETSLETEDQKAVTKVTL